MSFHYRRRETRSRCVPMADGWLNGGAHHHKRLYNQHEHAYTTPVPNSKLDFTEACLRSIKLYIER